MEQPDTSRSGTAVPVSPWAQLILIAAAFCLGRQSLPSRFLDGTDVQKPAAPALQPPRTAPQRRLEYAGVMAVPGPARSARPARPLIRLRAGAQPNRAAPPPVRAELEPQQLPPYPVLSRVFFGLEPPGTLPQKISGPDPSYTAPALDHEVEGEMRVACVVTKGGEVDRCRVLQGLPYMDVAVLQALRNRRYEPARLPDGRPVETEYVFVVRLLLRGELLVAD